MAAQTFLLHVHTSTDIVRKMTVSSRPESVDELKTMMKEKFKLDFDLAYHTKIQILMDSYVPF